MKLQAKLMLVIGGAAVAAALLILILTGFRINSISDGFAESSRKMRSESMRREATSAVFAEGAHLDSLFNGMFLRLYMLCLELHRRGGSAELDANEFRTSLKRTIYVTPEKDSMLLLPPEVDLAVAFGERNGKNICLVFAADSSLSANFTLPEELQNFRKNLRQNIGAIIVPRKADGTLWAALNFTEKNSGFLAAFRIRAEKLLKRTGNRGGDSFSMLVHGNTPVVMSENISMNVKISDLMKKNMLDLAARLVPLQNSRVSELETLENPGKGIADHRWEAAAITLKTYSIPARGLRFVSAFPYYTGEEGETVAGAEEFSGKQLIPFFFIILAGLMVFFPPLILLVRKLSEALSGTLNFANSAGKGDGGAESLREGFSVEFMELSGALNHLRDKISGMQIRLKKSHEREVLARRDAEASNRLKSALLNDMVYELKEPLNLIIGFSGLLMRKMKNQEESAIPLKKIHEEARSVNRMIHSMGELSCLDQADVEPSYSEFEVPGMVAEVRDSCMALSSERHVSLEVHCAEMPERIISDRRIMLHMLKLAASTLLLSARPRTKIKWVCEKKEETISFLFSDAKTDAPVTVADIYREHRSASGTASRSYPGFGAAILNLTILEAEAALIGAQVDVRREESADTVIEITIRKNDLDLLEPGTAAGGEVHGEELDRSRTSFSDSPQTAGAARKVYRAEGRSLEVLIAERSESGATMLSMMLENEKCSIVCVKSAEECLAVLKEKHFDILLLDLNLQRAFCASLISTIRREITHSLVLIAMTSGLTEAEQAAIMESGVDQCLLKPIGEDELIAAIRKFEF